MGFKKQVASEMAETALWLQSLDSMVGDIRKLLTSGLTKDIADRVARIDANVNTLGNHMPHAKDYDAMAAAINGKPNRTEVIDYFHTQNTRLKQMEERQIQLFKMVCRIVDNWPEVTEAATKETKKTVTKRKVAKKKATKRKGAKRAANT